MTAAMARSKDFSCEGVILMSFPNLNIVSKSIAQKQEFSQEGEIHLLRSVEYQLHRVIEGTGAIFPLDQRLSSVSM